MARMTELENELWRSKLSYNFRETAVPGTWVIEALHPKYGYPVGSVWYRWTCGKQINVCWSFVIDHCRRRGVRTYLHQMMLQAWPRKHLREITTGRGNRKSTPWLKKMGFVHDLINDRWVLTINEDNSK